MLTVRVAAPRFADGHISALAQRFKQPARRASRRHPRAPRIGGFKENRIHVRDLHELLDPIHPPQSFGAIFLMSSSSMTRLLVLSLFVAFDEFGSRDRLVLGLANSTCFTREFVRLMKLIEAHRLRARPPSSKRTGKRHHPANVRQTAFQL